MEFNEVNLMRLAKLARIRIEKEQALKLINDIKDVMSEIKELQKVDTKNVEPLVNVTIGSTPLRNDEVIQSERPEQIVAGSQYAKYNCFQVPKVIE